MKRIGDLPAPAKRRVSFAAQDEPQDEQGGIQPCHAQPCQFGGSIQCGSKWWYCRFHVNRPGWAERVVSTAMTAHSALAYEIKRGYNLLASSDVKSDGFLEARMLEHCEVLASRGYETPLELCEKGTSNLWIHDYRKLVYAMDKELSKHINQAVKDHKE